MAIPDIRPCRKCGGAYDHTRDRECPECRRKYQRKYHASPKKREYQREYMCKYRQTLRGSVSDINSKAMRRGHCGITTPLEEILFPPPDVCQCCGRQCWTGKRLALDHDHKTGEVRAWLCYHCNTGHLWNLTHEQALLLVRIMYEGYRPAWTGTGPV